MSDLGHVLLDLIPILVGLGFAFAIRFMGVWIGLYEVRHSQRLIADALKLKAAAEAPTPSSSLEVALSKIALALEAQVELQRRSKWEQMLNYLAQAAIVVGGVLALAALLRH